MKKLSLLLVLCLLMSLLAACGADPAPTNPATVPTTPTTVPTEAATEPAETIPMLESTGYHVDMPEGFVLTGGEGMEMALSPNLLSGDASNIIFMTLPREEEILTADQESLKADLSAGFDEGSLTLIKSERTEVDGYPALYLELTASAQGIAVYTTMIYVLGTDTYSFTFQDTTADRSWADAFAASVASINILAPGEEAPAESVATEPVDLGELETYDLVDLTIQAEPGMVSYPVDGYDACYMGTTTGITSLSESKTELGLTDWSLEHYADVVAQTYSLDAFVQDGNGNWNTSFTATGSDGVLYYYHATVREDNDNFYLIQIFCNEADSATMAPVIAQWASTLTLKGE